MDEVLKKKDLPLNLTRFKERYVGVTLWLSHKIESLRFGKLSSCSLEILLYFKLNKNTARYILVMKGNKMLPFLDTRYLFEQSLEINFR